MTSSKDGNDRLREPPTPAPGTSRRHLYSGMFTGEANVANASDLTLGIYRERPREDEYVDGSIISCRNDRLIPD